MKDIERYDVNEDWAHSGIVRAGNLYFLNYCVRDTNGTIEQQVSGAFDVMEERLSLVGLTLEYPARKSIQTEFADPNNLLFQVDAIAYSAK